jgi:hypothetical protein
MAALSDFAELKILDHVCGVASWSIPTVRVSLHTSAPSETGSPSNEVVAAWYARKTPATGWNVATTSGVTNNGAITWSAVTGSSVTVTHVGLYDALTSGNLLWYKALTTPKLFDVGSIPVIPTTQLVVSASGNWSNYLIPRILDHLVGRAAFTMPTPRLALYTTNPTAADSGTESNLGGYARLTIEFSAAAAGAITNANLEDFGSASSGSNTITHYGLRDAATLGNLLIFGPWDASALVESGDFYKLPAGNLDITLG